jgi:hypothetical protein
MIWHFLHIQYVQIQISKLRSLGIFLHLAIVCPDPIQNLKWLGNMANSIRRQHFCSLWTTKKFILHPDPDISFIFSTPGAGQNTAFLHFTHPDPDKTLGMFIFHTPGPGQNTRHVYISHTRTRTNGSAFLCPLPMPTTVLFIIKSS